MKICPISQGNPLTLYKYSVVKTEPKKHICNQNTDIYTFFDKIGLYNISFSGLKNPFYAIDSNGEYKKFPGRKEAADELKINGSSITQCLNGKRNKAGGYVFMWAKDIEYTDNSGATAVDKAKISDKLNQINLSDPTEKTRKPVYAISADGNFHRYKSLTEAAKAIDGSDTNIAKCLKGKQNLVGNYGFIYADEIETVNREGDVIINIDSLQAKAEEVKKQIAQRVIIRPFYAVNKAGNYYKFERKSDAEASLNVLHSSIKKCLDGERDSAKGFLFFYADEVESKDEQGNIILNFNIDKNKFDQRTPIPIYTIDAKGEIKKHPSLADAARYTGADRRNIDNCLSGKRETASGYAYILADELETINKQGEICLDNSKLLEKFKQVIKNAIYIVDKDGFYKRYNNGKDAAQDLGVSETAVIFSANGVLRGIKGHTIVKAAYIETLQDGEIIVNQDLLKKFAQQAQDLDDKAVWCVDSNGKRRRFRNKLIASQELGISLKSILKCLNHEQKTTAGYRFIYEHQGEKTRRKHRIIYAINGNGEVYEYENLKAACEALGVEKDEILTFLRKGRTKDKKPTLNGFVFATSNDE